MFDAALQREVLTSISRLSLARELSDVTQAVRTAARRLTGADGVTFVLKESGQCFYVDEDAIAPLWKGRRFPLSTCISGWVMEHREPAAIRDIYADDRIPHDAYRPTFVRSLLMVPVRREDPVAAIGAYWAREHDATDEEREILEALAQAASLALTNVTLWGDLQQALAREREARRVAEDASRLKDEFLATVSHELRTPLNVMQGWVRRLQHARTTPEQLEKGLAALARNTSLQTRLVVDLLDVSRAMGGQLALDSCLLNLADIAATVTETSRDEAAQKGIALSVRNPAPHALIIGDADRIHQILLNLLSNAIKFTLEGGRVEVIVEQGEGGASLIVEDTGVGISPDFLPHVFDRFRQADGTATRQYGGLGIGLAIVHELVRLHGGRVTAESRGEGQGTRVRVEFPVATVAPETAPPHSATSSVLSQPSA